MYVSVRREHKAQAHAPKCDSFQLKIADMQLRAYERARSTTLIDFTFRILNAHRTTCISVPESGTCKQRISYRLDRAETNGENNDD